MKSFMLALIVTSLSFSGCLNSSVENESAGSNSEETLITVTTNEAVSCELLAKGASYSVNGLTTVESSYNGCSNPNLSGLPTLISNLAIGDVVILSIDNDLACKVVITEMNLVLKGALCNINIDPKCPEKNWELGSPNPSWHGNQEPKLMHSYSPNEFWFVDYSTCDLSSFDLSNTNFGPSNFSYTNLTGANLENSDLSKVKLEHSKVTFIRGCPAKLPSQWSCEFQSYSGGTSMDADSLAFHFLLGPKSNLSGLNAYMDYSRNYQGRNLSGINLSDSRIGTSTEPWNLANANLENANFSNSDAVLELSFANLTNATFVGAILDGKITNADISVTDFQEAVYFSMDGRNLINCSNELLPADVKCANTTNFGLVLLGSRMNLSRIDLVPGQNFGYVNLEYSDLSYTNFTDAGLSNAVLYNTNFYGSNLSGTMFPALFHIPNHWVWAIELEACPILSLSNGDAYCLNNNIISPYAHSYLANLSNLDLTGIQLRVDHIDYNPYSPFFSSGWGEFPDGYDFALVKWENTICPDGTNSSDNVDLWGLGISPICTLENM